MTRQRSICRARIPISPTAGRTFGWCTSANMTSQLLDNIPDFTQVRTIPSEPLAATRMRVVESYTQEEFLRQLHHVVPRRAPGMEPGQSNVSSMLLAVVLQKIYGEPFESIIASQIEKPLRMGSGTQPNGQTIGEGIHEGQRGTAGLHGADGLFVGIAALQHRRPAALCLLAAGRAGRFGQARAPADLADARQAAGRGAVTGLLRRRRADGGCTFRAPPLDSRACASCIPTRRWRWCCSPTRPRTTRRNPCARCPRRSSNRCGPVSRRPPAVARPRAR